MLPILPGWAQSGKLSPFGWLYFQTLLGEMSTTPISMGTKLVNFRILKPAARKDILTQKRPGNE